LFLKYIDEMFLLFADSDDSIFDEVSIMANGSPTLHEGVVEGEGLGWEGGAGAGDTSSSSSEEEGEVREPGEVLVEVSVGEGVGGEGGDMGQPISVTITPDRQISQGAQEAQISVTFPNPQPPSPPLSVVNHNTYHLHDGDQTNYGAGAGVWSASYGASAGLSVDHRFGEGYWYDQDHSQVPRGNAAGRGSFQRGGHAFHPDFSGNHFSPRFFFRGDRGHPYGRFMAGRRPGGIRHPRPFGHHGPRM
jgi:hypothetical protein